MKDDLTDSAKESMWAVFVAVKLLVKTADTDDCCRVVFSLRTDLC